MIMARYRIETPVPGATTDLGDVHFHRGVAEVDEIPFGVRQYCEQNGYPITDTQPPVDEDQADDVPDDDGNPVTPPPANAKTEVWRDHVQAIGKDRLTEEQLAGLSTATRDQLKELAAELTQEGQSA